MLPAGFNEAAALHRGKRHMSINVDQSRSSFNEAAALHRGKPASLPSPTRSTRCFNEAAALHRGKLHGEPSWDQHERASMRPRLFTAENQQAHQVRRSKVGCFNEAAALHRGKQASLRWRMVGASSFNEAAALHRGKPAVEIREVSYSVQLQ